MNSFIDYEIIQAVKRNNMFNQVFIFNYNIGSVIIFADRELINMVKSVVKLDDMVELNAFIEIFDVTTFKISYYTICNVIIDTIIIGIDMLNKIICIFDVNTLKIINNIDINNFIALAIETNDIDVVSKIITTFVKPELSLSDDCLQHLIILAIKNAKITKNIIILEKVLELPRIEYVIDWKMLDSIFDYIFKISILRTFNSYLIPFSLILVLFGYNIKNETKVLVNENTNCIIIINKLLGLVNDTIIDKNIYSKLCNYLLLSKIVASDYMEINTNLKAIEIELKYNNILKFINKFSGLDPVLYEKISKINIKYYDKSLIFIPEEVQIRIKSFLM
jgi:hypothetical protein